MNRIYNGFTIPVQMETMKADSGAPGMHFQSQLDRDRFEKYVLAIAIVTLENGGSASRLECYRLLPAVDAWEFPKYPARTVILPPDADLVNGLKDFIRANEAFLTEPDCWLGTWTHPQTGCFYLDITTSRTDLEDARQVALEVSCREGRSVVALYNSKRRETIFLQDAARAG
jgi:hypothetical protein